MRTRLILPLLTLFLVTLGVTFSLLALTNSPVTAPTPFPTVTLMPPEEVAFYPPSPTPFVLDSQCAATGEDYELRVAASNLYPFANLSNSSPDGRFTLVKKDVDVSLVNNETGEKQFIITETNPSSGLEYRAHWSPDSSLVLFTAEVNPFPAIIETANGHIIHIPEAPAYAFNGWSPSNTYVAIENSSLNAIEFYETATGKKVYTTDYWVDGWNFANRWSPDEQWIAYTWRHEKPDSGTYEWGLTLANVGGTEWEFPIIEGSYEELRDHELVWSPDSRFITLRYISGQENALTEHMATFSMDGTRFDDLAWNVPPDVNPPERYQQDPAPQWQPPIWEYSSQFFLDTRQVNADTYELIQYFPANDGMTVVADNLVKPAFYASAINQIGLYRREDTGYRIDLIKSDGSNPLTFIEGATDAGDPVWSPDGKWVAVVWASGTGANREVTLTWMRPDGTERRDLQADFTDVRDLRWVGDSLAYIVWRKDEGNTVEIIDLVSAERRSLSETYDTLPHLDYDASANALSFMWQTPEGAFGRDIYNPDGTRLSHTLMVGDMERPFKEFWSPDGQTVALKVGQLGYRGLYDEMLVLAYPDGRKPVLVRSGLAGLGDPLWSPDSRQLAFTQWTPNRSLTLEIVSPAGERVYWTWNYQLSTSLEWSTCG
ncbi:MAG: hypothetical protein K8L97_27565 [Anaerolineae bacterium]|nr:hypothetical protein [Anaerolineae bacterium]